MRDRRHTLAVDDNLFQPLSDFSRVDISGGDGGELNESRGPARLSNLRSSTALAVNVFDAWKGHDLTPLSEALKTVPLSEVRLEGKYPTGLGRAANLDVVLHPASSHERVTAIEAKFIEPYDGQKNSFRPPYFDPGRSFIWTGLPALNAEALKIDQGEASYRFLKADQLIKHSIGLARAYGPGAFELIYLWYETPSEAAETHRRELEKFEAIAAYDIRFRSQTYNNLIASFTSEPVPGYFQYLSDRYGLDRR